MRISELNSERKKVAVSYDLVPPDPEVSPPPSGPVVNNATALQKLKGKVTSYEVLSSEVEIVHDFSKIAYSFGFYCCALFREFGVKIGSKTELFKVDTDDSMAFPGLFLKSWGKNSSTVVYDNLKIKGTFNPEGGG